MGTSLRIFGDVFWKEGLATPLNHNHKEKAPTLSGEIAGMLSTFESIREDLIRQSVVLMLQRSKASAAF